MEVEAFSGPVVITLSVEEATALGAIQVEMIKLAYRSRGLMPPSLEIAFSERLNAKARAAQGRAGRQVSSPYGPPGTRAEPPAPLSDQPVRLSTDEAAKLAEVDARTIRKWIARGDVQASRGRARGEYRVDIASLAARISQRRKEERHREAA